jgi:DNA-binding response OmpR family regulator
MDKRIGRLPGTCQAVDAMPKRVRMRPMSLEVLIADHDVELAMLYSRFLARHGFSAETVTGGLECLRRIRQLSPDVLVLDRDLPWGGGDGVVACLREEGVSVPVILTTWSTSPDMVGGLVVPPVVHCLRKFFPLPALLECIRFALSTTAS